MLDYLDDGATSSSGMLLIVCEFTWHHRGHESHVMCTDTFYVKKTITFIVNVKIQPLGKQITTEVHKY